VTGRGPKQQGVRYCIAGRARPRSRVIICVVSQPS
jgi:hypothetical protein